MIDYEIDIYDECARAVMNEFPNVFMSSVKTRAPAEFPAVFLYEKSNTTDENRIDSSHIEKGARITYEVRTYSNLKVGAKKQAKKLADIIDKKLISMNFKRTAYYANVDVLDASIYQVTATYSAGIDQNGKIYRK